MCGLREDCARYCKNVDKGARQGTYKSVAGRKLLPSQPWGILALSHASTYEAGMIIRPLGESQ